MMRHIAIAHWLVTIFFFGGQVTFARVMAMPLHSSIKNTSNSPLEHADTLQSRDALDADEILLYPDEVSHAENEDSHDTIKDLDLEPVLLYPIDDAIPSDLVESEEQSVEQSINEPSNNSVPANHLDEESNSEENSLDADLTTNEIESDEDTSDTTRSPREAELEENDLDSTRTTCEPELEEATLDTMSAAREAELEEDSLNPTNAPRETELEEDSLDNTHANCEPDLEEDSLDTTSTQREAKLEEDLLDTADESDLEVILLYPSDDVFSPDLANSENQFEEGLPRDSSVSLAEETHSNGATDSEELVHSIERANSAEETQYEDDDQESISDLDESDLDDRTYPDDVADDVSTENEPTTTEHLTPSTSAPNLEGSPARSELSSESDMSDEEAILIYPDVIDPAFGESEELNSTSPIDDEVNADANEIRMPPPPSLQVDSDVPPEPSNPSEYVDTDTIVSDVQIQGGDRDLQQIIQDVISVQVGEALNDVMLETDQLAIRGTGLVESVDVNTTTQPDGIHVIYTIEPIVVQSFQLTGSQVLSTDFFDEIFADQLSQPISPRLLNQGADEIDAWYLENGFTLSRVTAWLTDPSGKVIIEVIEPTIGEIDFTFLEDGRGIDDEGEPIEGRTREEFILRELDQKPGEVFNQDDLVGDVETLLSLGIFQDASVELEPNEDQENPTVDLSYRLEEGFARSFRVGGGVSTELGLFGSLNYRDRNFRGIGEDLTLGIQAGGRGIEFNTEFTSPYRESRPNRLGYSINGFRQSFQSLTFSDEVPLPNGDDARERRFGGGGSVMRPLGEWDAELGMDYARVSIRDDDGDIATEDALGNPLTASDSGVDDLLTLGFRVTQDRRINPSNPAGGSVLSFGTSQSIPVGNGSILMNRLTANYARFLPTDVFGSGSLRNPEVFAFNLQGGTILGDLPPYEAFNLGGMNSVRGYAGGDVGSGRSYILASAEYRFPLFSTLGGVLFTDFGSDLGTGSSVEGDPAGSRDKPGTGFGYGFGLRFGSPLGLLRADFGFNDQGENQFHFGFGQRF